MWKTKETAHLMSWQEKVQHHLGGWKPFIVSGDVDCLWEKAPGEGASDETPAHLSCHEGLLY